MAATLATRGKWGLYFRQYWMLSLLLPTCKASKAPSLSYNHSHLVFIFTLYFRQDLDEFSKLALNLPFSCFSLLISWECVSDSLLKAL